MHYYIPQMHEYVEATARLPLLRRDVRAGATSNAWQRGKANTNVQASRDGLAPTSSGLPRAYRSPIGTGPR